MFAEFETGVRSYWRTIRPHARTSVEILLARVGDRFVIPADVIQEAQTVRIYRNKLVHDREEEVETVTIADARHRLATYFALYRSSGVIEKDPRFPAPAAPGGIRQAPDLAGGT